MARDSLATRMYFQRAFAETARLIGYDGIDTVAFWDQAKKLDIPQAKLEEAVHELTRADKRAASPARYELTAEARKACFQLLGPPPEHPFGDFLRYGPPDIMGEENIKRWQEDFRRRKQAEADQSAEGGGRAGEEAETEREGAVMPPFHRR